MPSRGRPQATVSFPDSHFPGGIALYRTGQTIACGRSGAHKERPCTG